MKKPILPKAKDAYEDLAAERFSIAAKLNKVDGYPSAELRTQAAVRYKELTKTLNLMYLTRHGIN